MKFNEIFNRLENDIKNRYGQMVADWFLNTFYDYEIKYLDTAFIRLFKANMMTYHFELLKFQKLLANNTFWRLGTTADIQNDTTNNGDAESNNSYSGYNVESDFAKNKTTQSSTSNMKTTSFTVNETDEYIKLYSFDFDNLANSIFRNFSNLFLTIL